MSLIVQYPDITEVCYGRDFTSPTYKIQTEFAFYIQAPDSSSKHAENAGFKHVSSMSNWFSSHVGEDRELKLWWWSNPKKVKPPFPIPYRVKWSTNYPNYCPELAASGCGFQLGQPPFLQKYYYKFFSVLRMPAGVGRVRKTHLEKMHYRHLDTGTQAEYWVNGLEPGTWSLKKELKTFGLTPETWVDSYGNR